MELPQWMRTRASSVPLCSVPLAAMPRVVQLSAVLARALFSNTPSLRAFSMALSRLDDQSLQWNRASERLRILFARTERLRRIA